MNRPLADGSRGFPARHLARRKGKEKRKGKALPGQLFSPFGWWLLGTSCSFSKEEIQTIAKITGSLIGTRRKPRHNLPRIPRYVEVASF